MEIYLDKNFIIVDKLNAVYLMKRYEDGTEEIIDLREIKQEE